MTARGVLRDRIAQARLDDVLEVPVAGLEDVVVRYCSLPHEAVVEIQKSKNRETLRDNAHILVRACVGVFERVDGELVSVDPDDREAARVKDGQVVGDPLTFTSPRFAELVGVDSDDATDVVMALYADADGHLISAATAVMRHGGYISDDMMRALRGN